MKASPIVEKLRDPNEKAAFLWLMILSVPVWIWLAVMVVATFGAALLVALLVWLVSHLAELFFAAYVKTNAIEVSERQLPEMDAIVVDCCGKLGIERPAVYVMQENIWNAYAMRLAGRRVVVLFSGALDSLLLKGDMEQVKFLVGHELGHHAAGHLDPLRRLAMIGAWLPWIVLWHSRRCEITCDRIGLYCTNDLQVALQAVANLTVGAQLASQVNINEAIAQWRRHSHEVYVRYRTIYSTHPHNLWRMEELTKAAHTMRMGLPEPTITF